MKNVAKMVGIIALMALIGFSMTACDDGGSGGGGGGGGGNVKVSSTSGRLTITGLSDYNGKYAVATYGRIDATDPLVELEAADSISSNGTYTGGTISNGQVTLKVWKKGFNENDWTYSLGNFTGSGQVFFDVDIYNSKTITESNYETAYVTSGRVTGTFTSGTVSGVFVED